MAARAGVAGIEHSWGAGEAGRGIWAPSMQRRVLQSPHVPQLRSPSSCTRHPKGQPARNIPAAIPVKSFPEAEFLLPLGHSSQAGKIPAAFWDPAPSAKPEGNSLSIPRLCCPWDGIPRFHPEGSSRTSLWRAAGGQGMEIQGVQIGKKGKKIPEQWQKAKCCPQCLLQRARASPFPRSPAKDLERRCRDIPKEHISRKYHLNYLLLLHCHPRLIFPREL